MAFTNARILYSYDAWDAATVTASSEVIAARASNLLLDPLGKLWATASGETGPEWAKFRLAAATRLTCVCLVGGNWTAAATLRLQGNAEDEWSYPPYSQTLTVATDADGIPWRHLIVYLDQTYRYWRLTWDDPTNPDGRLGLGRVIAGQYYQLGRNFALGARIGWADPSAIEHKGGTVENVPDADELQPRYRQLRLSFPNRDATMAAKWEAIYRKVGNSRPVVLGLDPENAPTAKGIYGYLITDMEEVWTRYSRMDLATVVFEEKTR